jgi:copper chaperone NosL
MRLALLSILVFLGCSAARIDPPTLQADRTSCDKCRMLISETQYAAAYYDTSMGAGYRIFDDIGCMVRQLKATRATPALSWVHDFPSNTWTRSDSATYVYSHSISTPMNYGYIAFRDRTAAKRFADAHSGRVLARFLEVMATMEDLAK